MKKIIFAVINRIFALFKLAEIVFVSIYKLIMLPPDYIVVAFDIKFVLRKTKGIEGEYD